MGKETADQWELVIHLRESGRVRTMALKYVFPLTQGI